MYFKKNAEPIPEKLTEVWTCSNDDCSCWMRDDFSFNDTPECPICHSPMNKENKVLPVLLNHAVTS